MLLPRSYWKLRETGGELQGPCATGLHLVSELSQELEHSTLFRASRAAFAYRQTRSSTF